MGTNFDIGIIGLGRMGKAASQRLVQSGKTVIGWDINPEFGIDLPKIGGTPADSPRDLVERTDVILSLVTGDEAAKWLFESEDGHLNCDISGKLFLESATLQPATVIAIGEKTKARGAGYVGCPLIGTIPQVLQGELLVLAGGDESDMARAREALGPLAGQVEHLGPLGAGNVMKLILNLTMASYLEALAEGLTIGAEYGFEYDKMLDLLSKFPTSNPWLQVKREILAGGTGPTSLDISAIHKDVLYALATGSEAGISMPMASGILASLSTAIAAGHGEDDLAALPRIFRASMVRRSNAQDTSASNRSNRP